MTTTKPTQSRTKRKKKSQPNPVSAANDQLAQSGQSSSQQGAKEANMNFQSFEVPFTEMNEKMNEQTKKAFDLWKSNIEESSAALQTAFSEASKGFMNLQMETMGALQKQLEANMALLQDLMGTTNPSDFMEKANAMTKQNVEATMKNSKEYQEKFVAIANDAASPIKEAVEKASKVA